MTKNGQLGNQEQRAAVNRERLLILGLFLLPDFPVLRQSLLEVITGAAELFA
jgi:hypothetical protein